VDHQLRRNVLSAGLDELGVDALLVSHLPNVRYLSGFTGSNGWLIVGNERSVFLTDGRYTEQSRHEVPDLERITCLKGLTERLREQCERLGARRLGFEAGSVTVRQHERYGAALNGIEFVAVGDRIERQRWVKDAEELEMLRRAQTATDEAFAEILGSLAVGQSERQVALELERLIRRDGADGLAFEPIVAFGDRAAEPHHEPGHTLLEEGDVIKMDFGARWGGYHADMTRTVAFGEPAPELTKIHDVVRQAQQAGIDAIRAGVSGADADAAARAVIEDAGYGDRFTHGLGHGLGLEIHEGPSLGRGQEDVLPVGAVVTVEPGIYVPGLGGVRIEDAVEVTEDGCRVLPSSARDLIEL
jgi:Xaa-Pro aminopeptidase